MICKTFNIKDIFTFDSAKLENLDMAFFVYDRKISLLGELNEPTDTRHLVRISLYKNIVLFVMFVAVVSEKQYLSVMVIDKGKILGVSDCLSASEYCSSNQQRIYLTSQGKIGVIVDRDIMFAESVRNLYVNDADYIIHMTLQQFDYKVVKVLYAHSILNNIPILSVFADCFCCYSTKYIKCELEEIIRIKHIKDSYNIDIINKMRTPSLEL